MERLLTEAVLQKRQTKQDMILKSVQNHSLTVLRMDLSVKRLAQNVK